MHPIRSTALLRVGYDEERRVLTIQFRKDQSIWAFYRVPPRLYHEIVARQPHPWTKVCHRVMRYPKRRIYHAA